jgi:hypothetical protein
MMKSRIIKADFGLLLNRASLLCGEPFPVIAAALPCSAFSLPCYRITAKTMYKLLIGKDNKYNKLPDNREEKFSFPVLSLFRLDNSESGHIRSLAEILRRHPLMAPAVRRVGSRIGAKARRACPAQIRLVQTQAVSSDVR